MGINQSIIVNKRNHIMFIILLIAISAFFIFTPAKTALAQEDTIYKDGMFCYTITSEENKEVRLVGIESTDKMKELVIPGKAIINGTQYTVSSMGISDKYYDNEIYTAFFNSVVKIKLDDTFTGKIYNPIYAFNNLTTMEFTGKTVPESITVTSSNRWTNLDILFIVPDGMEEAYKNVIHESMYYYNGSDLYEHNIELNPTIVTSSADEIEYGCFSDRGLIYQVISSAKNEIGEVQLLGITCLQKYSYLSLPKQVTNNGYTYSLTKLCQDSLVLCGANVIVVPDTVTEMDSYVFDEQIELLFLSKNCKVIPTGMITGEGGDTNLRFVSVPEGVTTFAENAFSANANNTASIILPSTIQTLGKKALYSFKLVTFLNKKPISNIATAFKTGTTVKVKKSSISSYKSVLNSKVNVIAAKNITKATKLSVNASSVTLSTLATKTLTGTLSKGSNENIYWSSTDTDIFEISSKGVINPKKSGTAYAIAYTRTSGLHQAVKITVKYQTITAGIYQYRITDARNRTVTLYSVKPTTSNTKLNIPEKITYKNKTYTVTGVIADTQDSSIPLMSDKYENNSIKEVVFPKNIRGTLGYLGKMNHIKSITFLGNAPTAIRNWYEDGGLLAFQAVIYVPKNSVKAYTSALWTNSDYDTYSMIHYGYKMDFNIIENGSDKKQRFVKDGILYAVTKQAGTKNGIVAVKGASVTLKEISISTTVTNGKYTYEIAEISSNSFVGSNAEKIILGSSITKVGSQVFNEKVKFIKWSKNCKTINKNLFFQSIEVSMLDYQTQNELTSKSDFYAIDTFIIPTGVTTIQNNVFSKGFGNLKSITIPASFTTIGDNAFGSISEVIYE